MKFMMTFPLTHHAYKERVSRFLDGGAPPPEGATRFDLILIDVDHSPDEKLDDASAGFYTAAGLERAKRHLAPGGVLGVWSYAESSPFADALRAVFREVRLEEVSYENAQEGGESSDWLFFARD